MPARMSVLRADTDAAFANYRWLGHDNAAFMMIYDGDLIAPL